MAERGEVGGIKIASLEDLILHAFMGHVVRAKGTMTLRFAPGERLQLTPTKPNAARVAVEATFNGQVVGSSVAIVFGPGDGTGDTVAFPLEGLDTGRYDPGTHLVPRPKRGIHTEAQAPLFAIGAHDPNADLMPYAANYHLLGEDRDTEHVGSRKLVCIGTLGQSATDFADIMAGGMTVAPTATYTTGFTDPSRRRGRFADPHSVLNPHDGTGDTQPIVQACLFVAVGNASATPETLAVFDFLGGGTQMPLPPPAAT